MKRHLVALTAVTLSATTMLAFLSSARMAIASAPAGSASPSTTPVAASKPAPSAELQAMIARGEHLVLTAGCHDCHTPLKMGANGPEPDMSRALSGHPEGMKLPPPPAPVGPWIAAVAATNTAWSGPWGTSFTANLTSDKETGLGKWNKETFVRTIKTGRHMGAGRPILPPMPIPAYRNFSEDELGAMFAYLQTVPALKNKVPDPLPPPAAPPAPHAGSKPPVKG